MSINDSQGLHHLVARSGALETTFGGATCSGEGGRAPQALATFLGQGASLPQIALLRNTDNICILDNASRSRRLAADPDPANPHEDPR